MPAPMHPRATERFFAALGAVLVAGGLAHGFGVSRLYLGAGVPDANRVLLDLWVLEAQVAGGALYLWAWRRLRRGADALGPAVGGAVTVMSYAASFLPVLFTRASWVFRAMPSLYLLASVAAVV